MFKTPLGLSRRLVHPLLSSIILLIAPGIVLSQSVTATQRGSAEQPAVTERSFSATALKNSDVAIDPRLKALEDQLQQQSRALTEMRATSAYQQRLIKSSAAN